MAQFNIAETLKIFCVVVEQGSFSAAARQLGVTPAWVARSISRLEEHLGSALVVRSTRSLRLTPSGQQCLQLASSIVEDIDGLEKSMRESSEGVFGSLCLNIPSIVAFQFMGPIIADFRALYPKVRLNVTVSDEFSDLYCEQFDVVMRITRSLPDSGLIARKLQTVPRVLCATPEYLASAPTLETVEDLAEHHCLVFSGNRGNGVNIWELRQEEHTVAFRHSNCSFMNTSYLIRTVLLAHGGVAFLPYPVVAGDIEEGRVVSLPFAGDADPFYLYALRAPTKYLPARTRVFWDFLRDRLS
ncbi:LysR family transcriptional regulator [Kiloniella sp. b19]|uniref:LysR family transcriptional regulator n=1 Tax=Kiloniella sp. GXU_MW_B19 TaxID=3141326 RepID=UPI0031DCDD90